MPVIISLTNKELSKLVMELKIAAKKNKLEFC